ncbi:hypothetical protein So717_26850 [Roseobacter cerasinus]|uniref:Methyl-accepting transducer domain-containing protein n=1 Tax=Roseobacter cerasinus TaxID=2602289 RepID=A0A640VTF3_9RHOB|nr:methyl-accepting chemotaxis protein [Roseobacter cerasinus]GFE50932.1 hypothetical protein So717_26850 [Roseobacter cerasinus]
MVEDEKPLMPREIANTAEAHAVVLPRRMLSYLLGQAVCQLAETTCKERDAEQANERRSMQAALRYIGEEFGKSFADVADGMQDALADSTENLKTVLADLCDRLPETSDTISPEDISALKADTENLLAPAVTKFLSALFDNVVAHEKASARLARDVDSSALSQIDSLSRKINFIAVNASVEAARVGDQGRGFAVIASEIKDLSQQSRAAVERMRSSIS